MYWKLLDTQNEVKRVTSVLEEIGLSSFDAVMYSSNASNLDQSYCSYTSPWSGHI